MAVPAVMLALTLGSAKDPEGSPPITQLSDHKGLEGPVGFRV